MASTPETKEPSLEELFSQLEQVQSQSSNEFQLPERLVVDLLELLQTSHIMEPLLHSLDGKHFLTSPKLETEILQEVRLNSGRVSLAELPKILDIDISKIQQAINVLTNRGEGLQIIDGDLISDQYFAKVFEEMRHELEKVGVLHLDILAQRFNLDESVLMRKFSYSAERSNFQYKQDKRTIYTDRFVQTEKKRLRGALSGTYLPVNITQLQEKGEFHETFFIENLRTLVQDKEVFGRILGKMWLPAVFENNRDNFVLQNFLQNNFVDWSFLEKMNISNPQQYFAEKLKGVALHTCGVHLTVFDDLNELVQEAIKKKSAVDLGAAIKLPLTPADVITLLNVVPSVKLSGSETNLYFFEDQRHLVPLCILEHICNEFKSYCEKEGEKGNLETDFSLLDTKPATQEKDGPKKIPKKRNKSVNNNNNKGSSSQKNQIEENEKRLSKRKQIQSKVLRALSDLMEHQEEMNLPSKLHSCVADHLLSSCFETYIEASKTYFLKTKKSQNEEVFFDEQLQTLFNNISLFWKAIETVDWSEKESAELERHLMRTTCREFVFLILQNQMRQQKLENANNVTLANFSDGPVLKTLTTHLSPRLQKKISNLLEPESVPSFISEALEFSKAANYFLKPLDSKKETQLLTTHKMILLDQLSKEEDCGVVYHLVLSLIFMKKFHNRILHCPARFLRKLIVFLENQGLAPQVAETLKKFQEDLLTSLKNPSDDNLLVTVKSQLGKVKDCATFVPLFPKELHAKNQKEEEK